MKSVTELALKLPGFGDLGRPGNIPTGGSVTLQTVIPNIIIILIVVSIILTLIFILWGGIQWTTSQGNKEALQKARQKITFAIIGLVVVLLAFFIISFVGGLFGANLVGVNSCTETCSGSNPSGICCEGRTCQPIGAGVEGSSCR